MDWIVVQLNLLSLDQDSCFGDAWKTSKTSSILNSIASGITLHCKNFLWQSVWRKWNSIERFKNQSEVSWSVTSTFQRYDWLHWWNCSLAFWFQGFPKLHNAYHKKAYGSEHGRSPDKIRSSLKFGSYCLDRHKTTWTSLSVLNKTQTGCKKS